MYEYGRFGPVSLTDLFSILTNNIICPTTVTCMEHHKGSLALIFQWNLAYRRVNSAADKRKKKEKLEHFSSLWHSWVGSVPLLNVTAPLKVVSSADFLLPGISNYSLPLTLGWRQWQLLSYYSWVTCLSSTFCLHLY